MHTSAEGVQRGRVTLPGLAVMVQQEMLGKAYLQSTSLKCFA